MSRLLVLLAVVVLTSVDAVAAAAQAPVLDERPAGANEWGYRPGDGTASAVNPPAIVWRPQAKAASYEVQVAAADDPAFARPAIDARGLRYACYTGPTALPPGKYAWRFRYLDASGAASAWSATRSFTIGPDAVIFPMPRRAELIGRIPKQHPRLFVRPEELPKLRERARGDLAAEYAALVRQCEALLKNPPDSTEPPKYPEGVKAKSEEWRVIWWGNRERTIRVLNAAATLGFARLLDGNGRYGQLGKRLLMDAAAWDPKGATNYRYNDEAGMPYVYFFARAYTFLNDLLSEEEKAACREVIRFRGNEMLRHLAPRHLWSPYASHSNRAWHKLGEAGIAFLGEVPEAEEWTWFAMNVFWNVYPVWSDDDGGWHEGTGYWNSYIERFTHFADVMRSAMGVDAFRKPYFSKVGYYPLYLQPPGTPGGGFGDLVNTRESKANVRLTSAMAAQARNPHWQWYVEAHGGPVKEGGYIGFVRGALPKVQAKAPTDLPASRAFRGTGQAYLNVTLLDAKQNVELGFKSSPFGTQSHGYDANNTFFLYAYGQRLLVPTGRRDIYGSDHHVNWMWETKSTNGITVSGVGQTKHSATARGKIVAFETSPEIDYVAGEAAESYPKGTLDRFVRHVVFVKPELIVVYDALEAPKPSTFESYLHAPVELRAQGQEVSLASGDVGCRVSLLAPAGLKVSVTDQYDVPPRERIKVKEWHLKAATTEPASRMEFVTVIRPRRLASPGPSEQKLTRGADGAYVLEAALSDGGKATLKLGAAEVSCVRTGPRPAKLAVRTGTP